MKRVEGVRRGAASVGVEKSERHDAALPRDSGNAQAVVADGGNGSGDVGAVRVGVGGVVVFAEEVPAVDVIDVSVAIVIDAVEFFQGVDPDVRGEIGMGDIHAGIDDADDDGGGARGDIPGFGGVDIGIGDAAGLACVVEAPEGREACVIGKGLCGVKDVIGFGEEDGIGFRGEAGDQAWDGIGGGGCGGEKIIAG